MESQATTETTVEAAAATNATSSAQAKEIEEAIDRLQPLKFDNKAFELEDVAINSNKPEVNPFDRQQRPGSMMSIKSNASNSSRSSINCTTGRIKCPNFRLKKFFSYNADAGFAKASEDVKGLILPEKDGNFIGNWLLAEISNWDLHREKVVLLTDKTLIIVSYDFINKKIYSYKRISLSDLKKVKFGTLQYPKGSFMGAYLYGAVKLTWDNDDLSLLQRWNPFGSIPYLMFTSHPILYNDKEKESEIYNCDEFISSLEYAINKLPEAEKSKIEFKEEQVEIESYASLISVLYNQNWMGFQLDRNGLNF